MQHTQLQKVLKIFTPKEVKRFGDFLASPYHNSNKNASQFWQLIKKYAPEFSFDDKEREKIFRKIFANKKFNDGVYRNLLSDVLQLVFEFIGYEELQSNEEHLLYWKAEAARVRMPDELFEKSIRILKEKKDNLPDLSTVNLEMDIWLERFNQFLLQYKYRSRQEGFAQAGFESYVSAIINFALYRIYNIYINEIRAENEFSIPLNRQEIQTMLNLFDTGNFKKNPLTNLYYYLLKLVFEKKDEYYFELKKIFLHSEKYAMAERMHTAIPLVSFLSDKIRTSDIKWQQELFEIYDYRVKQKLWTPQKPLSYIAFFNIVANALELDKISYAENFIRTHENVLIDEVKKDILNLCNAWVAWYKKEHDKAYKLLSGIQTENILIKYELRTLQAIIYYETGETEALESLLKSFREFIQYNQNYVPEIIKSGRMNFCKYLSKINLLKINPDKSNGKKFLRLLDENNDVFMKSWLKKQVVKIS